jgi:transposase
MGTHKDSLQRKPPSPHGGPRRRDTDITTEELRAALAERGHAFGYGTLQRFFRRHGLTRKKRPGTRPSRTGRTS